jgi:hypothetical protein
MDDHEILQRIGALVEEERRLEASHVGDGAHPDDAARLHEIEVALDQCWDLLRQRRARRGARQDPAAAELRPPATVERYQQ